MVVSPAITGFSAGGEFASATAFSSPRTRRGAAWLWFLANGRSGPGRCLLDADFGALLLLRVQGCSTAGTAIPFLFWSDYRSGWTSIFCNLDETSTSSIEQRIRLVSGVPAACSSPRQRCWLTGMVVSGTISFYVVLITFRLCSHPSCTYHSTSSSRSRSATCEVVLIPICGVLSDFVGRKPVMITALVLDLLVTYPLFSWVSTSPSFGALLSMPIIRCGLFGVFNGPISTALAETVCFVRSTALAITTTLRSCCLVALHSSS